MRRHALGIGAAALFAVSTTASPTQAAPVRGKVEALPTTQRVDSMMGYTRTRVAGPAKTAVAGEDYALFLKVLESLPIPKPEESPRVEVRGLRLVPHVAACATDGQLVFVNTQAISVTLKLAGEEVALAPGDTYTYECTAGEPQRRVRVKEWPHIRGLVYVGEVGVAGRVDDRGAFTLVAPDGKYELLLMTRDGVVAKRPVEIAGSSVDVGTIDPKSGAAATP